jgi:large subunit ribosomal protein L23
MAAKKKTEAKVAEWMYGIIQSPVVTEKSTMGSLYGQVTFKVPTTAKKPEIKAAVEALFKVNVTKVNTAISKGKTKVFKGTKAFRSDTKKAIVTLQEGQTIDVGSGL